MPTRTALAPLLALVVSCSLVRHETRPEAPATPADERVAARAAVAEAHRKRLAAVEASGPSDEPWTREAAAVFAKWPAPRAKGARPRFAPPRCFRDACVVTVEYASVAQYETFDRSFPASEGFAAWPGIRYRTAPVARPDGTLAADWVLYRPSGDAR